MTQRSGRFGPRERFNRLIRMTIWLVSDTHFGHAEAVGYTPVSLENAQARLRRIREALYGERPATLTQS